MRTIALVTTTAARDLDEDLPPLAAALTARGFAVETPSWDDASVEWSRFALALLRSTWDYTERLDEFLDWARATARRTRLLNPTELIAWNTDKRYLATLERSGVPIIPSAFFAPGEPARLPDSGEFVVKPSVGAGSRGAKRFGATDRDAALAHTRALQAAGFMALVQPYLASVDANGETALLYFDGQFSHAVRKGPLLTLGGSEVEGLFAPETITPRVAQPDELEVGRRAVAAIPGGAPLYARVDLIRDEVGMPRVLELELTEPSMFFMQASGSAERFAAAIAARLQ